jgi:hypothetical protein
MEAFYRLLLAQERAAAFSRYLESVEAAAGKDSRSWTAGAGTETGMRRIFPESDGAIAALALPFLQPAPARFRRAGKAGNISRPARLHAMPGP